MATKKTRSVSTQPTHPRPVPGPSITARPIVAAAARVRLKERSRSTRTLDWQREAWMYFDIIGEVKYAIMFKANLLAKMRLFPALVPSDPREVPLADDDDLAHAALASLKGPGGSYAELLREGSVNLDVAGECYLVGVNDPDADDSPLSWNSWDIMSSDELRVGGDGTFHIRPGPGEPEREYTEDEAFVSRIWLRHPRYSFLPDSPLRGVLSSCEEIERIEKVIRAAAKSRSAGPGILLVPEEMSFGNPDPTTDSAGDGEDINDPFTAALMDAMMTPIQDEGSASSVVPFVVRAPGDMLDKIRRVTLAIDIDEKLVTMERALIRLAQGLNLPPEIVTGKADLNHWTAFQVSDELVTGHIEPSIYPLTSGITTEYYRVYLEAAGMSHAEAQRRMLWHDPTPLMTRPNRSADADFGLDHIALSDTSWRRVKGFTEADAPTLVERISRLVLQRGNLDPTMTALLFQLLGVDLPSPAEVISVAPTKEPTSPTEPPAVDVPVPRALNPAPPRQRAMVIAASAAPDGAAIGSRLLDVDRDISTRLRSAADAALRRALDRASSIVVSKFRRDDRFSAILSSAPKLEVPSRIGAATLAHEGITVESLLESVFDPLGTLFTDWSIRAYARAARILQLRSEDAPDELTVSQHTAEASAWLISALSILASERLFNPSPTIELFGELDDETGVPFAIIREAMARAGGAAPDGIYVTPGGQPMGGIATGALILGLFQRVGGGVEGWEWAYGEAIRSREFLPHRDLDGLRFTSWSEGVLANRGTFPPVAYYAPGDHSGCLCAAAPIVVMPAEQVA